MSAQALSPDTEVVLLLCGRFGGERQEPFQPLSAREYGELAKWLNGRSARPSDLLSASADGHLDAVQEAGLARARLSFLLDRGTAMALALDRWTRGGVWVMSRGDPGFPWRLKRRLKGASPPLLYGVGSADLLDVGGLAIVGSRDATEHGLAFARDIAEACEREGICVVSGGARGVDATAMHGATDVGGYAIGVLANDLLKTSLKRENRIPLQQGRMVLVCPFHPEAGFNAGSAMARNKLIYALSDRALVVDSAHGRGGTWTGAQENLVNHWVPLYVRIPGDGSGNDALVQSGADVFPVGLAKDESLAAFFQAREAEAGAPSDVLANQGSPARHSVGEDESSDSPSSREVFEPSFDMYAEFIERLAAILKGREMTEDQLAAHFGLEKSQLKVWLGRALLDERIGKLSRPVRYVATSQASLLG